LGQSLCTLFSWRITVSAQLHMLAQVKRAYS
jgi:hypothetical protein